MKAMLPAHAPKTSGPFAWEHNPTENCSYIFDLLHSDNNYYEHCEFAVAKALVPMIEAKPVDNSVQNQPKLPKS